MSDALARARELYEKMDFSSLTQHPEPEHITMDNGRFHGIVAYKDDGVEVMHVTCEPGTYVEEHAHEQAVEHILLYQGDAVLNIGGVDTILQPSHSINVPPLAVHSLRSVNGCKMLMARIPPIGDSNY